MFYKRAFVPISLKISKNLPRARQKIIWKHKNPHKRFNVKNYIALLNFAAADLAWFLFVLRCPMIQAKRIDIEVGLGESI